MTGEGKGKGADNSPLDLPNAHFGLARGTWLVNSRAIAHLI